MKKVFSQNPEKVDTNQNFHHGRKKVPTKNLRSKRISISPLDASALGLALAFISLAALLQGCTLLFVAKGGTRYVEAGKEKAPKAASQAKEMNGPVVVHYQVRDGDSFSSISERYYGDASKSLKIARANRLSWKKKPKAGTTLKILDPFYFPGPKGRLEKAAATPFPPKKIRDFSHPPNNPEPSSTSGPAPAPTPQKINKVPRPKLNGSFAPGEKLKFEIRALSILGGYGSMEVGDYTMVNERPCLPLIIRANAVLPLSSIFNVDDLQTSYFDSVDFLPWKFQNKVMEGSYKAHNLEMFDQLKHRVVRTHNEDPPETIDIAPFSQDIISCFYYFRLLPLELGKTYDIPTQSGGKNYHLVVNVVKREKITVPAGTFDCFRVKPLVKQGTVFRNNEDIDLWVTADSRHIPVKIQTGIVIGTIDVDLLQASLPPLPVPTPVK